RPANVLLSVYLMDDGSVRKSDIIFSSPTKNSGIRSALANTRLPPARLSITSSFESLHWPSAVHERNGFSSFILLAVKYSFNLANSSAVKFRSRYREGSSCQLKTALSL